MSCPWRSMVAARSGEIRRKPLPTAAADQSRYFFVYFVTGTVTKKVGKDVVDREFAFCIFCSSICLIVYGGCFMVRTAVMRVRSGNYRAAPYLNSFAIVPVALGWRGAQLLLIGHTWECSDRRDAVSPIVLQGADE